jgi:hypothetical protein
MRRLRKGVIARVRRLPPGANDSRGPNFNINNRMSQMPMRKSQGIGNVQFALR